MKVRDFKNGIKVAFATLGYGVFISLFILPLIVAHFEEKFNLELAEPWLVLSIGLGITVFLTLVGFIVNYTPLSVKNGIVSIPASDQIRTLWDILILNPITGLYRRREYSVNDVQSVANGYTKPGKGKEGKSWNVVIAGIKDGKSFSQKIDVSNKQVRDEVRNLLKQTISGKVSNEFSY